jgi:RNA polymerase sigma-70 factor (ECF subfamily)
MTACANPIPVEIPDRRRLDVLAQIYARHRRLLERLAFAQTGNRDDAMDAVQESFLKAIEGRARLRDAESALSWLRRITSNRCHDLHRHRRCRPQLSLDGLAARLGSTVDRLAPAPAAPGLSEPDRALVGDRVAQAIGSLPVRLRSTCELWFVEGLSIADICRRLGLPPSTAKARLAVARAALVAKLRTLARSLDLEPQPAGATRAALQPRREVSVAGQSTTGTQPAPGS